MGHKFILVRAWGAPHPTKDVSCIHMLDYRSANVYAMDAWLYVLQLRYERY